MKRIKYTNFNDTLYTPWYTVGPNMIIRGLIDFSSEFNKYLYQVIKFDESPVSVGSVTSLREAKAKLRTELIAAGLVLEDEIRRHTTP